MSEVVLQPEMLQSLRSQNVISENEVAISVGDLFYAKNVLTNEKRIIKTNIINQSRNENLQETTTKTLLKG
jgi:hypothetical protein